MAACKCRKRHCGYLIGVVIFLIAFVVYVVGFACPNWLEKNASETYWSGPIRYEASLSESQGLFLSCGQGHLIQINARTGAVVAEYGSDDRTCQAAGPRFIKLPEQEEGESYPGWFKVVRGLEGLCETLLAIAVIYALVDNTCATSTNRLRVLEVLAGLGGLIGFIGCMTFFGQMSARVKEEEHLKYGFAVFLTVAGCILTIIAAIIIAVFNREIDPAPSTNFSGVAVEGNAVANKPYATDFYNHPVTAGENISQSTVGSHPPGPKANQPATGSHLAGQMNSQPGAVAHPVSYTDQSASGPYFVIRAGGQAPLVLNPSPPKKYYRPGAL